MSQVYLAEQLSLGRQVAIKVLPQDLALRPEMAERFRREAQLLASVDHPSVVRVIDFQNTSELTCLVLELVEGETLESELEEHPLAPDRAVGILTQLAEALAAIHAKGIVHRDLKPKNVVLTRTPRGTHARLIDFGIATLTELPAALKLSQPGHVVGTPAYLSPEQASGAPLDARSDIYSFGVLAFRALTGVLPFAGPGARDFLVQHLSEAPRRIEEVAPELREAPALCHLVMRCLDKNPAQRPVNGGALLRALERIEPCPNAPSASSHPRSRLPDGPRETLPMGVPIQAPPEAGNPAPPRPGVVGSFATAVGRLLRRRWRGMIALAVVIAALPSALRHAPRSALARAEGLLKRGRPEDALPLIDGALRSGSPEAGPLLGLQAAALHRLRRHDEEHRLVAEHRAQALAAPHPLLLESLAEHFAENEADQTLRELLESAPAQELRARFAALAQEEPSRRQWGALRYLDLSGAEGLDRVALYAASLRSSDCEVRRAAARRLAELDDLTAIPALRQLSETPKEDGLGDCGQDEAAEAIRALRRRAAIGSR